MKKFIVLITVFTLMLCLCSCGSTPKTEKNILSDIKADTEFTEIYPEFTPVAITIEKRQTDKKSKTDLVYATVNVKSTDESIEGEIYLILSYGLYDKGWLLDSWTSDETKGISKFVPLYAVEYTEEDFRTALENACSGFNITEYTINSHEFNPEDNSDTYNVSVISRHKYVTYDLNFALVKRFNTVTGRWDAPVVERLARSENWNIKGEYKAADEQDSYVIEYEEPQSNMYISGRNVYTAMDDTQHRRGYICGTLYSAELPEFVEAAVNDGLANYDDRKYIQFSGYKVKISGDSSSLYDFDFFTNCGDTSFFIGRDKIAVCHGSYGDVYTRNVIFELKELTRIE